MLAHDEPYDELMSRVQNDLIKKVQPSFHKVSTQEDWRLIGQGCQILSQLGYGQLEILSPEKKLSALSAFNLEVVCYIPYLPKKPLDSVEKA